MKNLNIVLILLGCVIGAGFVSGNEIYIYFSSNGTFGAILALIYAFLLYFFIIFAFKLKKITGASSILQLNKIIFPNHYKFANLLLYACYFGFGCIMLAGFQTLFGSICTLCFLLLLLFLLTIDKSIEIVNKYLTPLVLIFLCVTFVLSPHYTLVPTSFDCVALFKLIGYISTNLILILSTILKLKIYQDSNVQNHILVNASCKGVTKKTKAINIRLIAFVTGFIVFLLILVLSSILPPNSNLLPMPIFALKLNVNPIFKVITCFVIGIGITTTFYTSVFSIIEFKNKFTGAIVLLSIMFVFSFLQFNAVMHFFYAFVGVFAVYYEILIALKYLFFRREPFFKKHHNKIHKTSKNTQN